MIGRFWRGWTSAVNAGVYERHLTTRILPGIHRIEGYRGTRPLARYDEISVHYEIVAAPD